jgi:YD repeat-containing protein
MQVIRSILGATAKYFTAVHDSAEPGINPGRTLQVEPPRNRRQRLILGIALSCSIVAGSTLAMPNSRIASWMRNWHRSESPQEVGPGKTDYARFKSIAPATARELGFGGRFLLPFAAPVLVLNAPTSLGVSTTSSTQISINWTAPSGTINHYQIERSTSLSGPFTTIGTSATTSYDDTGLSGVHSYLYRVRAVDSFGAPSAPSNMALGTSIAFTDPTLYANVTEIKAQHIYDLRQAIDAVRALVPSLSTVSWTPYPLDQVVIHATDVQDLRDKLGDALSALNISAGAYEDSTLATGNNGTLIKKVHIEQLRDRSTRGVSTNSGPDDNIYAGSSTARLDPLNRTGGGAEDPLARNFNWSIPLVGLPGRGGLDLGLSLAYNSLATWTRNGNVISFDDDQGSPAPGFRLGLPIIQQFFNNAQGSKSFLMITASGARVELRQVGTSDLYQAVDSSYLLLDSATMRLRTTSGTQLSYVWKNGNYECAQIKDSNGNYLTINYDTVDRIDTIIDTLSRTIHFNYDSNGLSSITQTWAGQTHYWARFTYASKTIQTNFANLTVNGPPNNSTIHALTQVKLADDSHYDFDYTSWGQVWKISQYTGETSAHLLNYRSYNLPADNSTAQTDCPRFTVRYDWAENWNRDTNGNAQEVNTNFAIPVDAALPDNSLATVTRTQVTTPDGTYQQIYFAGNISGGAGSAPAWKRGLPLLTDTFDSSNTKQRSATNAWTQDDTNVTYPLNPRVTETNITDPAGNHARTSVDYAATTLPDGTTVNLPQNTYEYQADASTQLRRTHVDYNLTSTYTSLRIIGLVSEQTLYGGPVGSETLMSKVSYQYDESGSIQGTDAPVQHDNTNYSASLVAGRGNLSSVKRYDVNNTSQFTTSTMQYNTAGAVVATLDPLSHGVTVSYADSFSDDNNSRNTFAYPTTLTDAGGFSSSMKYNYDFGAATRKQTPLPNVTDNEAGPVQTIEYDSLGRLQKTKNLFNNAYTRYEYPASQNRVDTYATIQDNAGEAHSFRITDGHGRVIASAADHPGSTGGYSGQLISYDTMGRVIKQSNPTETSASGTTPYSWAATGDDATAGWLYSQQTYDWKGRPLVTTNTDNTTKSASYGGCGCAGGEVVTLTDEATRTQKIYSDVLGRTAKSAVLNWDGTVYTTTVNTFNERDQVMEVRQYQGAETSGIFQVTAMTYDGYGRLQTKHVPAQTTATVTTYSYNANDTVQSATDARGASASYGYNGRDLPTSITYSAPAGITATANVSVNYDAAGNRISMTDGFGGKTYSYNQLSQLTSETRSFTNVGTFTLSYDYSLGGQLRKITDPTNMTINYGFDSSGQLSDITGSDSLYAGVSTYASNIQYRAWGAAKHLNYGNSLTVDLGYNKRGQTTQYDLKTPSGAEVMGQQYQYTSTPTSTDNDGRLKYSHDLVNSNLDRTYYYDQAAKLTFGDTANGGLTGPYRQTYGYDVWGNMTNRSWRTFYYNQYCHCMAPQTNYSSSNYTNNRNTATGWNYDADGRLLASSEGGANFTYAFDAAGQLISNTEPGRTISQGLDGDGLRAKWVENGSITYYVRSSALAGQTIVELDQYGQKVRGYVYGGQQEIAKQEGGQVLWDQREASGVSMRLTNASGSVTSKVETDPLGTQVSDASEFNQNGGSGYGFNPQGFYGDPTLPNMGCRQDGFEADCNKVQRDLTNGVAVQCPNGNCGPQAGVNRATGRVELFQFSANAAAAGIGTGGVGVGFLPNGVNFVGNGFTMAAGTSAIFSGMGTYFGAEGFAAGGPTAFYSLNQIEILRLSSWSASQEPVYGPGEEHKIMLNRAFGDASSAIAPWKHGKNPCLTFFTKGRSLEEISKIFANFWHTAQSNPYSAPSIAGTINSGQGMNARLHLYAPFFANTGETQAGKLAGYNWEPLRNRYEELYSSLTPRQYRALVILHEFAHALGLIPSDKDDKRANGSQSQKNDEKIYEKCGDFLSRLPAL